MPIFSGQLKLTGRWYNFRTGEFFPGRWNYIRTGEYFPGRWNNIRTAYFFTGARAIQNRSNFPGGYLQNTFFTEPQWLLSVHETPDDFTSFLKKSLRLTRPSVFHTPHTMMGAHTNPTFIHFYTPFRSNVLKAYCRNTTLLMGTLGNRKFIWTARHVMLQIIRLWACVCPIMTCLSEGTWFYTQRVPANDNKIIYIFFYIF